MPLRRTPRKPLHSDEIKMRRPVKPFVTEYKGSGRRGKEAKPETDAEEAEPKASEGAAKGSVKGAVKGANGLARSAGRRGASHAAAKAETLDSYEAAMRAADALFSPRAKAEADGTTAGGGDGAGDGPRDGGPQAAGAGAAGRPARSGPSGQPESTGRVLQALDEPEPAPEPMEEPAPKRRGRKPGSVNRPAPAPGAADARRPLADVALPPSMPPLAAMEKSPDALAEVEANGVDGAAAQTLPIARPAPRRQRERFPWVRTTLRPGEKWKRRLPKVAW